MGLDFLLLLFIPLLVEVVDVDDDVSFSLVSSSYFQMPPMALRASNIVTSNCTSCDLLLFALRKARAAARPAAPPPIMPTCWMVVSPLVVADMVVRDDDDDDDEVVVE